jgi:nucleoside-diphosphate-sugar epimerase
VDRKAWPLCDLAGDNQRFMSILITGAFGFVGTNLSAYLAERGHELWALDVGGGSSKVLKCGSSKVEEVSRQDAKTQRGTYARRFNWEELEEIPWGEVDAVIHLAGKAHDTKNTSDAKSYFDVNVGLTKKVITAWENGISHRGTEATEERISREGTVGNRQSAIGDGQGATDNRQQAIDNSEAREKNSTPAFQQFPVPVKKFILFSSVKAVADRVDGVLTEDAVPDPQTPYGQSKLEAEEAVQSVIGDRQSAIRSYILRPCMIHGPGNKGNLNLLYGVVKKGIPWPLGAFENRRSFTSIGNLCAVIDAVLACDIAPGVYQMADDEALSTNELIELMAAAFGKRALIWRVPAGLVRSVARVGDGLHLPLNSERLKKLTESYVASNAKIKAALGWKKMPVNAREGMRKTLETFSRKGAKTPRN